MARRYWLMKSDPDTFGLPHLRKSPKQTTCWDGVRNYQARNLLRDEIRVGDGVLFYHSQSKPPAVMGTAKVVRAGYPISHGSTRPRCYSSAARFRADAHVAAGAPTCPLSASGLARAETPGLPPAGRFWWPPAQHETAAIDHIGATSVVNYVAPTLKTALNGVSQTSRSVMGR